MAEDPRLVLTELEKKRAMRSFKDLQDLLHRKPYAVVQFFSHLAESTKYGTQTSGYYYLGIISGLIWATFTPPQKAIEILYDDQGKLFDEAGYSPGQFLGKNRKYGNN